MNSLDPQSLDFSEEGCIIIIFNSLFLHKCNCPNCQISVSKGDYGPAVSHLKKWTSFQKRTYNYVEQYTSHWGSLRGTFTCNLHDIIKYAGKRRQSNGYVICISVESCCLYVIVQPRHVMERWARRQSDVGVCGAARWHASCPPRRPQTVTDNDVLMYSPMYRSRLPCTLCHFCRYNMYLGCTFLLWPDCSVCRRSMRTECGRHMSLLRQRSQQSMSQTPGAFLLPQYSWLA